MQGGVWKIEGVLDEAWLQRDPDTPRTHLLLPNPSSDIQLELQPQMARYPKGES